MEENELQKSTRDSVTSAETQVVDGYIAPEVLAAFAGEQAGFSMHLAPPEESLPPAEDHTDNA